MNQQDWNPIAAGLPAKQANSTRSALVLAIVGFTRPQVVLAAYDYHIQEWVGEGYWPGFGSNAEGLITYWMPLPLLPTPTPTHEIEAIKKALEPDFVSANTTMRALFNGISPDDKQLQATIGSTISRTGLQGTAVRTRGVLKGNRYFVDFIAYDPVELSHIKANLDALDVPYVISVRHKK